MKKSFLLLTFAAVLASLLFGFNACKGPGETSNETILGSPTVSFDIRAYESAQPFSGMRSCVQGITLFDNLGRGVSYTIKNDFGIPSAGVHLADLDVPPGNYAEILLVFSNECNGSDSLEFSNASGTYSTADIVTVRFEGTSQITSGGYVSLNIEPVVNTLNTVTDPDQIIPQVQANPGNYTYNP